MNILGLLALHSFVCTVIAEPGNNSGPKSIFDTPLGGSKIVYLVGFSAELNSSTKGIMKCVHSTFTKTHGNWVERRLLSEYQNADWGEVEPRVLYV
ncbi:hypothetical protein MTO96_038796 [Rhipicephalus appendiculatus]